MTPEQSFTRWVRRALCAFILLFAYFVIADSYMPMTPEARIQRHVVPVAAQVSALVSRIHVENNQHVSRGQLLFELDDSDYRLALQQAELGLRQARTAQKQAEAALAEAVAAARQAGLNADELQREAGRIVRLHQNGHMSQQRLEQARVEAESAGVARLAADARRQEAEQSLRAAGIEVERAGTAREQAALALSRTRIHAAADGRVGNLQLQQGNYAAAGQALLALISDQAWVTADLREKSLRHVQAGTAVDIVFDALPGRVFAGHITSIDVGVREGQQAADGQLAQPVNSDRWVRDAQRLRTHITLDEEWPPLATGARATVQLYPSANPLLHGLAATQAWLVSQLRYLY
ncbi:HlyD family secretion protein [Zobellella endophytica]|uniref:HlyD family secretion protein n=1 Tax=Zobellella endophytica TaxID=2116700 RepID=A0A2P7R4N9_9GAMM|nr:HlyD family secretion protein [Zobellella endophytica]PSJ45182.1 HlyD family secretion protein [Zobellella endophytica]